MPKSKTKLVRLIFTVNPRAYQLSQILNQNGQFDFRVIPFNHNMAACDKSFALLIPRTETVDAVIIDFADRDEGTANIIRATEEWNAKAGQATKFFVFSASFNGQQNHGNKPNVMVVDRPPTPSGIYATLEAAGLPMPNICPAELNVSPWPETPSKPRSEVNGVAGVAAKFETSLSEAWREMLARETRRSGAGPSHGWS